MSSLLIFNQHDQFINKNILIILESESIWGCGDQFTTNHDLSMPFLLPSKLLAELCQLADKKHYCFVFSTVLVLLTFNVALSQTDFQSAVKLNFIPPPPNAFAIAKYGAIPVSYYTGTPNIDIPIFSFTEQDISIPISLKYHASGIRVEEMASNVGLGWSLNAGGVITRTVIGLPDDHVRGYYGANQLWRKVYDYVKNKLSASDRMEFLNYAATGHWDTEPDSYTYSYPGGSGKFFIDTTGVIRTIPHSAIKIVGDVGSGFTIIDERGISYAFATVETTTSVSSNESDPSLDDMPVSWYLTSVSNPRGHEVGFGYDDEPFASPWRVSESHDYLLSGSIPDPQQQLHCPPSGYKFSGGQTVTEGRFLNSIGGNSFQVEFKFRGSRQDVGQGQIMDSIIVKSGSNVLKKFALYQSYFGNGTAECLRLKLDSISEIANSGKRLTHRFSYVGGSSGNSFPCLNSKAQDHWGYINSNLINSLLPGVETEYLYIYGADREPDPINMKLGSLQEVIYPTGGKTEFEFEPHDYGYSPSGQVNEESYTIENINQSVYYSTNSATTYFEGDFFSKKKQTVIVNYSIDDGAHPINQDEVLVEILGPTMFRVNDGQITGGVAYVKLDSGWYTVRLRAELSGQSASINFHYKSYNGVFLKYKIAGGLRIKATKDHDALGNIYSRNYYYTSKLDSERSSGFLVNQPLYTYDYLFEKIVVSEGGSQIPVSCYYCSRTAQNQLNLGLSNGSHINYSQVSVMYDSAGSTGRETFQFTSPLEYSDTRYNGHPFPQPTSFEYRRGHMLESIKESKSVNGFNKIQRGRNTFSFPDPVLTTTLLGVKIGYIQNTQNDWSKVFADERYNYVSQWKRDDRTMQIDFSSATDSLVTVSENYFDPLVSLSPSLTKQTNSQGEITIIRHKYPKHFQEGLFTGIDLLKNLNINEVIESQRWLKQGADSVFVNGIFNMWGVKNNFPVVTEVYTSKNSQPILSPNFNESMAQGKYTNMFPLPNVYTQDILVTKYDNDGNIVEYRKADNIYQSYVWGYNSTLPIVEVINATTDQIFTTSFEDPSGTAGVSRTGNKYYNGSTYTIPASSQPTAPNLKMTFWYYDGSWKFQEETSYSPTIAKAGATRYDEIRVYPAGALMTTYTHDPGVGVTSISDPNQRCTYYVYDEFNRLRLIKDDKGNIVTQNDYNYKN